MNCWIDLFLKMFGPISVGFDFFSTQEALKPSKIDLGTKNTSFCTTNRQILTPEGQFHSILVPRTCLEHVFVYILTNGNTFFFMITLAGIIREIF